MVLKELVFIGACGISLLAGIDTYQINNDIRQADVRTGSPHRRIYLGFDEDNNGSINRVRTYTFRTGGRGSCYVREDFTPENPRFKEKQSEMEHAKQ